MIPAFLEGIAQSFLPCSWIVVVPAVLVGASTSRPTTLGAFSGSVVFLTWALIAGWVVPPLWVAGLVLLGAAVAWWIRGIDWISAMAIGAGAAWAWRPCVGAELGKALNTAQQDALAALPGLASFVLGLVVAALLFGQIARAVVGRAGRSGAGRAVAAPVAVLGATMVVGLYSPVSSALARWSTSLWS